MNSGIGAFSAGTIGKGGPGPRELGGPLRFRGDTVRLPARLPPGVPGKACIPGSGGPGPRLPRPVGVPGCEWTVGVPGCDGPKERGVPVFGVPPPGVPKPGPPAGWRMDPGSSGAMVCLASST